MQFANLMVRARPEEWGRGGVRLLFRNVPIHPKEPTSRICFSSEIVEEGDWSFDIEDREQLMLPPDVAQSLMDQLWDCGIRPVAGAGSAGQLEAVQAHLKDMQNLAHTLLEKVLKS